MRQKSEKESDCNRSQSSSVSFSTQIPEQFLEPFFDISSLLSFPPNRISVQRAAHNPEQISVPSHSGTQCMGIFMVFCFV